MLTVFTSSFITSHQIAFDEYLALGVSISQKAIVGEESYLEYTKARKLQTVLKARRNTTLTEKEAESLDGCLSQMSERQFIPSLSAIVDLEDGFILNEDGGYRLQQTGFKTQLEVNA